MMELVDILGLGSSSFKKSKGSNPFFGSFCAVIEKLFNLVVLSL